MEISEDGAFDISSASPVPKPAEEMKPITPTTTIPMETSETSSDSKDEEEDKSPPPPGNGGKTDLFVWTQTLSELNVNIPMPPGTKAKMLEVDIRNTHLKVNIENVDIVRLMEFVGGSKGAAFDD